MATSLPLLCVLLASTTFGSPVAVKAGSTAWLIERQDNSTTLLLYSLPNNDPNLLRSADIANKQATFLYGPAVGAGPPSPAGPLGEALFAADSVIVDGELGAQVLISTNDSVVAHLNQYGGLKTLDDYTKLYDAEWQPSSQPTGQDPGMLTNYTQDLLFSMERLSLNPYAVRRLAPTETLPFTVDDATVSNVTGQTLSTLLTTGRLFYADHRNQSALPRTGKFAVACDAYFYISKASGDFLPLAIRTNFGSNLIYTPKDTPNDWLFAKMMYNNNDFFMGQADHLARNHFTQEIIGEAAIRTLSDSHPVLAILTRLLYGAYAIRALALLVLIRPGGDFDEYFGYGGQGLKQFSEQTYNNGYAGAIQANYFKTNLQRRGLLDSPNGPALKSFPFYEDSLPLYNAIHDFMTSFVNSYYSSSASIAADNELQAWLKEANGPAGVIDFPTSSNLKTPADLALLLTEIARLGSFSHHAVNLNELITGSALLPFHPTAFYTQIPTSKGVSDQDIIAALPPLEQCLGLIGVTANFARPLLAGSNRTMVHMFDDPIMLARMNTATQSANEKFKSAMLARSQIVKSRGFGGDGLSQGMPFVWKGLDPNVMTWSLTI